MTAPQHRTHTGALHDLAAAVSHLEQESPEQSRRLKALYRAARQSLRKYPLAHRALDGEYRRVVLVPFKLMVVYVTDGRNTDILAVFDARREPKRLQDVLAERTVEQSG